MSDTYEQLLYVYYQELEENMAKIAFNNIDDANYFCEFASSSHHKDQIYNLMIIKRLVVVFLIKLFTSKCLLQTLFLRQQHFFIKSFF